MKTPIRLTFVLSLFFVFGASLALGQTGDKVKLNAYFQLEPGKNTGRLFVDAEIEEGWNMYATTTPAGGPMKTKITVLDSDQFVLKGPFAPSEDPHLKFEDVFQIVVQEHQGFITWSAPIALAEGVDSQELTIDLKVKGQSCAVDTGVCTMVNKSLAASVEGPLEGLEMQTDFAPARGHVAWSGLAPKSVVAGSVMQIELTAEPMAGYKIYGFEVESQGSIAQPTRIAFAKSNGCRVLSVQPKDQPLQKNVSGELQKYHTGSATWTVEVQTPEGLSEGVYQFEGYVAYQNCTEEMCDPPSSAMFTFEVNVGEVAEGKSKIGFARASSYSKVAKLADRKNEEAQLLAEHE